MNWDERYRMGNIGKTPEPMPGESDDRNEHLNFDDSYHRKIEYMRRNTPCMDCNKTDVQLYCSFPDYDQVGGYDNELIEGCPGIEGFREGDKLPNGHTRAMTRLVPFDAEQKCPACHRNEGLCMSCLSETPEENLENNHKRQEQSEGFQRFLDGEGPMNFGE